MHRHKIHWVIAALTFAGFVTPEISWADPPRYTITRITPLNYGQWNTIGNAWDINEQGQICGEVWTSSSAAMKPFIWENGNLKHLGFGGWATEDDAHAINDSGWIACTMGTTGAFLWEDNALHPLGTGAAYGINNSMKVVGESSTRACSWENGTFADLGTLGGSRSRANDVNESGLVVGWSNRTGETHHRRRHPVVWEDNSIRDLGFDVPSPGGWGEAWAVNDAGQVVGYYQVENWNYPRRAFLWDNGVITDLHPLGDDSSHAKDINNRGLIVGFHKATSSSYGVAFLYDSGVMHDLSDLLDNTAGWDALGNPQAINDAGQIVGVGKYQGSPHLFLMTPIPEPGTMLLLGVGAAGLLGALRRRTRH